MSATRWTGPDTDQSAVYGERSVRVWLSPKGYWKSSVNGKHTSKRGNGYSTRTLAVRAAFKVVRGLLRRGFRS
jgi:hypothetical protein